MVARKIKWLVLRRVTSNSMFYHRRGGRQINSIIVDDMPYLREEVLDTKDSENASKGGMCSRQFESDERNAQVQDSK